MDNKAQVAHLQSQLDAALSQNYAYKNQIEKLNNAVDAQSETIHENERIIADLSNQKEIMRAQIEDLSRQVKV